MPLFGLDLKCVLSLSSGCWLCVHQKMYWIVLRKVYFISWWSFSNGLCRSVRIVQCRLKWVKVVIIYLSKEKKLWWPFQRLEAEYFSTCLPAVQMSNLEQKLKPDISYLLYMCIQWSTKIKHTFTLCCCQHLPCLPFQYLTCSKQDLIPRDQGKTCGHHQENFPTNILFIQPPIVLKFSFFHHLLQLEYLSDW